MKRLPRFKKLSPRFKTGAIVVLLAVFFAVVNLTGFSKEVKSFFYFISSPIQKTFWQVGDSVSDFFETIAEIKNLKKEDEELKLKNQEFLAQIVLLKALKKENEILRKALEIDLKKDFQLALAEVIGKDISQDSLLINKGLTDGIFEGMPVITEGRVLIGRITEPSESFSKVLLISNPNSSFDVKIQEREVTGVAKGKGNFQLLLDLIPKDQEIKEGDLIVTTSLGGIFPKEILVGRIQKILRSDIKPFQQALVSPFFDITKLETVFMITEY